MARDLLSAAKVKHANVGMHADGGGLYLQVTQSRDGKQLNKSWLFMFRSPTTGKRREMGLGSLDVLGLSEARDAAESTRKLVAAGQDPIEARNAERAVTQQPAPGPQTFERCAVAYIAAHEAGWRSSTHREQWRATMRDYAYPVFGSRPVDQIDTDLVLAVLMPLWANHIETGTRVRARIESILDWARVKGYRAGENPARWRGHLDHLLAKPARTKRVIHHPAIPYAALPAFLVRLRELETTAAWAFEMLILTAARRSEALGARWSEIDVTARVWTIPGNRMKGGREHRVPLSGPALSIIERMRDADPVLVFPGVRDRQPLDHGTFWKILRRMQLGNLTAHGFRSTFKEWCVERTEFPDWLSEKALAHVVGDETRRAYQRGDLLEKRRLLMDDWAEFCES
jgi:integrase